MTLRDCYAQMGGNYDDAVSRLMNESLMERFMKKFLSDPSFNDLKTAIDNNKREDAFRAAHTLKGVAANLAFTRLRDSSSLLTETLRNTTDFIPKEAYPLFIIVGRDYKTVIETIESYFA